MTFFSGKKVDLKEKYQIFQCNHVSSWQSEDVLVWGQVGWVIVFLVSRSG